jgi:membrane-bound ClpP family serine protease
LNPKRKFRTITICCLLALSILVSVSIKPAASVNKSTVILIRVDSNIDYKTVDLVDQAAQDIKAGRASALLIQLNSGAGYWAPTLNIVNELRSLEITTIAYIGPNGAIAAAYAAYLAMATSVLAMNEGTIIGKARIASSDSVDTNALMNLMRELATSRGRNAEAAQRMTIDNLAYSATEAHDKGVCDLVVDNYASLLKNLNLDQSNVIERTRDGDSVNNQDSYALLKLLADPTTIKYLFFAVYALVLVNLLFAATRPRRTKTDETYQALLDLMHMEMQTSVLSGASGSRTAMHETPLHTPANIPSDPTFKLNKLPTPDTNGRMERPLEVRKR